MTTVCCPLQIEEQVKPTETPSEKGSAKIHWYLFIIIIIIIIIYLFIIFIYYLYSIIYLFIFIFSTRDVILNIFAVQSD